MTHDDRKQLIAPSQSISVRKQAELLEISRASLYYQPIIDPDDLRAMRCIDSIYTKCPFYGSRKLRYLLKDCGIIMGRHHIRRLMRIMGLEAIYPKKSRNTSISNPENKVYPYLIRGVIASHANHIWGVDITYIRLERGWCYLVAVLDWYSRYVVGWEVSDTMESSFCIEAMREAITNHGTPDISNSDQGSQFTDHRFTGLLAQHGIKISMDGRGRCMDNIFTERLWRNVKYEEVYLKSYRTIDEARIGIANYFQLYNNERPHQSLEYKTPFEVYYGKKANKISATADSRLTTIIPSTISTMAV